MAFLVGVRQGEHALRLDALLQDGTADREGKLPPVLPLGELELEKAGDAMPTVGEGCGRIARRSCKEGWEEGLERGRFEGLGAGPC